VSKYTYLCYFEHAWEQKCRSACLWVDCWYRSSPPLAQIGKLPLHYALKNHVRSEVVTALLKVYPSAMIKPDAVWCEAEIRSYVCSVCSCMHHAWIIVSNMYIHVCICICVYILYVYIFIFICIHKCTYTYLYIHICVHIHIFTYIFTYLHIYIYMYVHIYIYIYICVYIYI